MKVVGHNIRELVPYVGLLQGNIIDFKEYHAQVIEINPLEFGLLNEQKQDGMIRAFTNALRRLSVGQTASLVKLTKPMVLDSFGVEEERKQNAVIENYKRGMYSDKELEARGIVFDNRAALMEYYNNEEKIYKDHFYFVVFSRERGTLQSTVEGISSVISQSSPSIANHILNNNELIAFLKANYGKDFDEREIANLKPEEVLRWIMPNNVKFKASSYSVDGKSYNNFTVMDYPMTVGNAWGYRFFNLADTRVVMNFSVMQKLKSEKMLDKAILEMTTQLKYSGKASTQIEKTTALDSMRELLTALKTGNEQLFDVNINLSCETYMKKEVRARLRELGLAYNEMFCRQTDAFISTNCSRLEKSKRWARGIQTSTLAGVFPFISSALQDPKGFYIGYNQYPVFVDFFKRDRERVNSNMIVIGRSGGGKSFATKTVISNLASDDAKVFICDPENEYELMAHTFGGKIIDVGNGAKERFNPFHVVAELEDDDDNGVVKDNLSQHLQFLEEFFKIILEGIDPDAAETLNKLVVDLYRKKGINTSTDVNKLKPTDYPIFDDLYRYALQEHERAKDEYSKKNLRIVVNYVSKFSTGGRIANLWNGPTNIESTENFMVFSFRSLLANRNEGVARAQMLLTFKYLDNEIIKNREFNLRHKANRRIIIVVDEAHTFINPKFPIALDFMFQMAKRIRKYNGMQIIITQNIRDFMGSEDMIRQSSAIIAASQYSMIFSLSANDVTELVKLYKNAGEINETEQDQIATAGLGECFFITGNQSRTQVKIDVMPEIRNLFDADAGIRR
jgi:hypothetical protein